MNQLYDGIYYQKLILKTDNFEGVISPLASFGTCEKLYEYTVYIEIYMVN